jgi:hypothetical protein
MNESFWSRLTLRKEGQVGLRGETSNDFHASATLLLPRDSVNAIFFRRGTLAKHSSESLWLANP